MTVQTQELGVFEPAGSPGQGLFAPVVWLGLASSLRLSRRELEIVQLVFDDQKEASIATRLGISRHTVNTYMQRLYQKLKISSRSQLILRVVAQAVFRTDRRSD